jgi:hypothetical protein
VIGSVSAHRRANAFAQALDAADPEDVLDESETADPEQVRMLAVAGGLAALPAPEMDPQVKTEQRAQLIAAMETMFATGGGGPTVPEQRRRGAHRAAGPLSRLRPRSRWSRGVAAGGIGVGVAAGAFGGVAAASTNALPGDTLYGLKRGMEDLKLSLADGDSERGRLYLDQASTRLNEARRLMERGRSGDLDPDSVAEVRRALNGVKDDAGEGHRLLHNAYTRDGSMGPIKTLSTFSQKHRRGWTDLSSELPTQLHDVSDQVTSVFDAIDQEVGPLSSLLPPDTASGSTPGARPGTRPDGAHGNGGSPAPSPSTTPSPGATPKDGEPEPSASGGADGEGGGLLGSDGLIETKPSEGSSPSAGGKSKSPKPEITLPPLLPGILPGLGLTDEEE